MTLRKTGLIAAVMMCAAFLSACCGKTCGGGLLGQGAPVPLTVPGPEGAPPPEKKDVRALPPPVTREVAQLPTLNDIYFDFDEHAIRPPDREVLRKNALWFRANPGITVRIEGHSDDRGTAAYNRVLAQKRADAAKAYLVSLGVPANMLTTVSYGKERPFDRGHDEHARANNRRVHLEPVRY